MTERPILFSAPMVRAILEGRKTQTRRVVKPQPEINEHGNLCGEWLQKPLDGLLLPKLQDIIIHCPYGQPGDRVWVPEAFRIFDRSEECACYDSCTCAAMDGKPIYRDDEDDGSKWFPASRMHKNQSRILLEIVSVRVERLQDISDRDAIAEGIKQVESDGWENYDGTGGYWGSPINSFETLWESINGLGSWESNPWVWVVEVRRVQP